MGGHHERDQGVEKDAELDCDRRFEVALLLPHVRAHACIMETCREAVVWYGCTRKMDGCTDSRAQPGYELRL
jgi:hypothetical protein